jgi:tight adherence protein C
MREYRNGFPDFMDLMIVCSDAGMSMEAGIERVSKELLATYPSLADNLRLVSLELRAGRSLDDALKALSDRLSLDEVRSFATLLQQSKELGTCPARSGFFPMRCATSACRWPRKRRMRCRRKCPCR